MRYIVMSCLILLIAISCQKKEKPLVLGEIVEVSKVILEKPSFITAIAKGEDFIVYIDHKKMDLVAMTDDGKVFWTYNKQGKGPGEFSRSMNLAGFKNNTLYVLDSMLKKIVLFTYDASQKSFTYDDEVVLKSGTVIDVTLMEDGAIAASVMMGKSELVLLSPTGEILKELIPTKEVDLRSMSSDEVRAYFTNIKTIKYFNMKDIIRTNDMDCSLVFGSFSGDTYTELKTIKPKYLLADAESDMDVKSSKNNKSIMISTLGFTLVDVVDGSLFVIAPKQGDLENLHCETYDIAGTHVGEYLFSRKTGQNPARMFFVNKNTVMYQRYKDDKAEKPEVDESTIYFAEFRPNSGKNQ